MSVIFSVSGAGLFDKISTLEIKRDRLTNLAQLANDEREHTALSPAKDRAMLGEYGVVNMFDGLQTVNETFWQIDLDVRDCKQAKDFAPPFVELAHSICTDDEEWVAIKRRNNEALSSKVFEEN